MSKVKNCLTCAYEPEWKDATETWRVGECRYPVPKWLSYSGQNTVSADCGKDCPAHQPKENE